MRLPKEDIPIRLDIPGAVVRHLPDFGTAASGPLAAEYFSLATGTDIAPLLKGLQDDACQSVHWGFVVDGDVVVTYTDGKTDHCTTGDVFHWPAGHSVRVERDAELILFSPQYAHAAVMDHMVTVMASA